MMKAAKYVALPALVIIFLFVMESSTQAFRIKSNPVAGIPIPSSLGPLPGSTPVHEDITQEALDFLIVKDVIAEGNRQVDQRALSPALGGQGQKVFEDHMIDCDFTGSVDNINDLYDDVLGNLNPQNPSFINAAVTFGRLLHTVQDFYAHTNWVELVNAGLAFGLVEEGVDKWADDSRTEGWEPFEKVQGVFIVQEIAPGQLPPGVTVALDQNSRVVSVTGSLSGPGLISAKDTDQDQCPINDPMDPTDDVKLPHFDLGSGESGSDFPPLDLPSSVPFRRGLNKDYPRGYFPGSIIFAPFFPLLSSLSTLTSDFYGRSGFPAARALAVQQTQHEWCRLVNLVGDMYGQTGVDELFQNWVDPNKMDAAGCTDIAITMTDSSDPVLPGDKLIYAIEITNNGPFDATGVHLEDSLPAEVLFDSFTTSQGSCTLLIDTVDCDIGDMANGDSVSVTVDVTVASSTSEFISNEAKAEILEADGNLDNNAATEITGLKPALAFASDRSGRFHVWKVPISPTGTPEQVTRVGGGNQESRAPDWSKDGRIAFQFGAPGVRGIHTINPDGSDDVRVTTSPSEERDPSWSPDGQFIAYSFLIGGDFDIWIHDTVSGQDFPFFGLARTQETRPTWSPDGTRIAFVTTTSGGDGEIAIAEVDTSSGVPVLGDAFLLTDNSDIDFDPTWSPDSTQIAFSSTRTGGRDIYRMSAEFGEGDPTSLVRLTEDPSADRNPAWSPDGKKIAFVSERSGNRDIYIMSAIAGETDANSPITIQVTAHAASDDDPAWAPAVFPPELDIKVAIPPVPSGTGAPTLGIVKITNASDQPITGAIVTILGPLGNPPIDRLYLTQLNGLTDMNGEFTFEAREETSLPNDTKAEFAFLASATINGQPETNSISHKIDVIGVGGPVPPTPPGMLPNPPDERMTIGAPAFTAQQKALFAQQGSALVSAGIGTFFVGLNPFSRFFGLYSVPAGIGFIFAGQRVLALSQDPPDPEFHMLALPQLRGTIPVMASGPISTPSADLMKEGLSTKAILEAYLNVLQTSVDRYFTALDQGDLVSAALQRNAILAYGDSLNPLFEIDADLTEELLAALQLDGVPNITLTQADVVAIQTDVAANGFPGDVLDILQTMGFSASEIQEVADLVINADPAEVAGDLFSSLQTNAEVARDTAIISNEPPTADDQNVTTGVNTPVDIILTGSDADGDLLSFTVVSDPAGGILSGITPNLTYTPDPSFVGPDAFTYKSTDGTAESSDAIVAITFGGDVNNPPMLAPIGDQTVEEGTILDVAVSASDPDGDPITLTASGLPPFATFADKGDGTGTLTLIPGFDEAGIYPGVEITASDGDLTDSEMFIITVNEITQPPVSDAGLDQTIECASETGTQLTLDGTNSSDPDGDTLTFTWTGPFGTVSGPTLMVSLPLGTHTITLTVDDGADGTDSDEVVITVEDTTPPVPDLASLPDVTGECSAEITSIPMGTDSCAGMVTGTTSDPLSYTEPGTFPVTWTFDDGNGNTTTQTQTVVVQDTTSPVPDLASLPDVIGECSAEITSAPTATDNCAGTLTGTTSDPLSYLEQGTFTATWIFDDGNGNTSTQTQTVVVQDSTAPIPDLTSLPDVTGECSAEITSPPTATDNCTGTVIGTTSDPLSYAELGTFTVTWTFDDGNGNASTQTQTVVVQDVTPPDIASITASPDVLWPPNHKMVPVTVAVSASDNCGAEAVCQITEVSSTEPEDGLGDGDTAPDWEIAGDLTVNLRAERSGTGSGRVYAISVECTDASGNGSMATVPVTVPHNRGRVK